MKKLCTELSKQSTLTLIILPDCMSFQEWDFLCNPFTGSETGQPPHQPNWTPEDRRLWPGQSVFWGERQTLQPPGGYKVSSYPLTSLVPGPVWKIGPGGRGYPLTGLVLATEYCKGGKGWVGAWNLEEQTTAQPCNPTLVQKQWSHLGNVSRNACSTARRCTLYPSSWLVERIILRLDSYGFVIAETRVGYKGQVGDCFWKVSETVCGRLLSEVLCWKAVTTLPMLTQALLIRALHEDVIGGEGRILAMEGREDSVAGPLQRTCKYFQQCKAS